ncbi:MAG TPA: polyphosphate kinase 2 family protein [Acidimicrobiales bacterium]|nr:polyphosphate kinase 2 family protein [Acidimicrobiales bacterium]
MKRYRITDGSDFHLADWDPADTSDFEGGKRAARAEVAELKDRLDALQERFYADNRHRLLVVLQGMDTSGKGGAVKVFTGMNPAGVRVTSFKAPTEEDLAHDYLWRVHPHVPADGQIAVFDRSHYEDVLIARVRNLVPAEQWERRYDHIRHFERMLADEGTVIRKFFLHISREAQRRRLQARLDDPTKHWKFRSGDLAERQRWGDYQAAYEMAIGRTSTEEAPWYVVPADRKWHRDLVIARTLVETLEELDLRYPEPEEKLDGIVVS